MRATWPAYSADTVNKYFERRNQLPSQKDVLSQHRKIVDAKFLVSESRLIFDLRRHLQRRGPSTISRRKLSRIYRSTKRTTGGISGIDIVQRIRAVSMLVGGIDCHGFWGMRGDSF